MIALPSSGNESVFCVSYEGMVYVRRMATIGFRPEISLLSFFWSIAVSTCCRTHGYSNRSVWTIWCRAVLAVPMAPRTGTLSAPPAIGSSATRQRRRSRTPESFCLDSVSTWTAGSSGIGGISHRGSRRGKVSSFAPPLVTTLPAASSKP